MNSAISRQRNRIIVVFWLLPFKKGGVEIIKHLMQSFFPDEFPDSLFPQDTQTVDLSDEQQHKVLQGVFHKIAHLQDDQVQSFHDSSAFQYLTQEIERAYEDQPDLLQANVAQLQQTTMQKKKEIVFESAEKMDHTMLEKIRSKLT